MEPENNSALIPFKKLVVIGQTAETERLRVITRSLHLLLVGLGELWRRRWSLAVPLHGHRPDPAQAPLPLPQRAGGRRVWFGNSNKSSPQHQGQHCFCTSKHLKGRVKPVSAWFCSVPQGSVPLRTIPYHTVSYRSVLYRSVLFRTVPHRSSTFWTVPHSSAPFRTVSYHFAPFRTVLFLSEPLRYKIFCKPLSVG